jgi:hypothetical protein
MDISLLINTLLKYLQSLALFSNLTDNNLASLAMGTKIKAYEATLLIFIMKPTAS